MKALVILLIGFAAHAQQFGEVVLTSAEFHGRPMHLKVGESIQFSTAVHLYFERTHQYCVAQNDVVKSMGISGTKELLGLLANEKINLGCIDGLNNDFRLTNAELTGVAFKIEPNVPVEIRDLSGRISRPAHWSLVVTKAGPTTPPAVGVVVSNDSGKTLSNHFDMSFDLTNLHVPTFVDQINQGKIKIKLQDVRDPDLNKAEITIE